MREGSDRTPDGPPRVAGKGGCVGDEAGCVCCCWAAAPPAGCPVCGDAAELFTLAGFCATTVQYAHNTAITTFVKGGMSAQLRHTPRNHLRSKPRAMSQSVHRMLTAITQ